MLSNYLDPWTIAVVILAVIVIGAIMTVGTIRSYRHRVTTGKEAMVGNVATAETDLNPRGVVLFEGERWQALSESDRIAVGEEVIVTGVDRLRLRVARKSGQGGEK